MRATDAALNVAPPTSKFNATLPDRDKDVPIQVVPPGSKGGLEVWWSSFKATADGEGLRARGITDRFNLAVELVDRFEDGVPTAHVPMEDFFSIDDDSQNQVAMDGWVATLPLILPALRALRDKGAVVNINCKMGKNRSGVAVLLWLVVEEGWELDAAIQHLREISYLALGNPCLLRCVAAHLGMEIKTDVLCPDPTREDGLGWISISPPPSPRVEELADPNEQIEDGEVSVNF
eukprot:TRINITY_DN11598_c0_g1_i1.p1 TRINITY_DN11598_c0_g1~~TRINITY_DN11598_c0_g1_i1.p1  ORF type:complete len:234 (-),score=59.87 TRINITY_DN11598_c0_g1_i1:238-939(-)